MYALVEAVVLPREGDASGVLGDDKVFSARDVSDQLAQRPV